MNKEILYKILNSDSEKLSIKEIEGILNEELEKTQQEMDTELIDLCIDAITSINNKKQYKIGKKFNITKIIIAAVIFILLIGLSIPVGAKYLNIDVPTGILKIYNNCFNIKMEETTTSYDISTLLDEDMSSEIVLPNMIFSKKTSINNYVNKGVIVFEFQNEATKGNVVIEEIDENNPPNIEKVSSEFENIKQIEVNGIVIMIFSNKDKSLISYYTNNALYNISLNCNYDTALKIAETI